MHKLKYIINDCIQALCILQFVIFIVLFWHLLIHSSTLQSNLMKWLYCTCVFYILYALAFDFCIKLLLICLPFSALLLTVGWQKGCSPCENPCSKNFQNSTFARSIWTWSNLGKLAGEIETESYLILQSNVRMLAAALMALKRKKRYEKQLQQIDGTLSTIEFQREALQNASTNTEVLNVMSVAAKALKSAHKNMYDQPFVNCQ